MHFFAVFAFLPLGVMAGLKTPSSSAHASFITNAEETRSFAWTSTTRTAREAMELTFPKAAGWTDGCFWDGGCDSGQVMTQDFVANWVEQDLLSGPDPFAPQGGKVPVPWPAAAGLGDQLGSGQYVGYSRRQVCFIVAKALLGAGTQGYANGLTRILNKTVPHCGFPAPSVRRPDHAEPSALTGEFGMTLWNLLSACAADPSLEGGRQGPLLLVAKGKDRAEVAEVRQKGHETPLAGAHLSACRYDDGDAGPMAASGLETISSEICTPPTNGAPGRDFMTGGFGRVKGQAIQDISAKFLGGYVFGNACGLGGGQDERLMTYFPEVFALTFFLSQDKDHPQLREPAWVLGARMLMIGLDGPARFDKRLELDAAAPMTADLVQVEIDGTKYEMSSSTPFLAFMSENQDFLDESAYFAGRRDFTDMQANMFLARQNRHPLQRAVDANTWYSFMYQVRAWYSAVALTSYSEAVRPALTTVVKALGAGPFLSGLWFGDSQLGFLTMWIAHAIAAPTWGSQGLPLQYYIYADFTENPGNQCFVHSEDNCLACLARCEVDPLPPSSYWLPAYAFMDRDANHTDSTHSTPQPCVLNSGKYCGKKGIEHMLAAYGSSKASELWAEVERVLGKGPQTEKQVFDLLLAEGH